MKKINLFVVVVLLPLFFASCSSDDTDDIAPEGDYAEGIFILNEGTFGSGNSTVSFMDMEMSTISHDIYGQANNGEPMGDTGQSIGFYEDYAFVVLNVSNRIEVVNRNTFEHVASIDTGLENPRHIVFSEGKGFVSNWGDGMDETDDFIAVIDLNSFSVSETISVDFGPERMAVSDEKVVVAHMGGFSFNNKVSILNATSNTVENEIAVGHTPNGLEIRQGKLWVSCHGIPAYAEDPDNGVFETAGGIYTIDLQTNQINAEMLFEEDTQHPEYLRIDQGAVYFTLAGALYSFSESTNTLPSNPVFEMDAVEVLYGFNVKDGLVYATSAAPDFTGNGALYVYDAASGSVVHTADTAINPNGIYFNE